MHAPQTHADIQQIPEWLPEMLDAHGLFYQISMHHRETKASRTAEDLGMRPLDFAKTVILDVDGSPVMAVLPANHVIDLPAVANAHNARIATLVPIEVLPNYFPDCELGAQPPFGRHYGMDVIVSAAMALDERITFNAGSHACAITMSFADYQSIVKPRILNFTTKQY